MHNIKVSGNDTSIMWILWLESYLLWLASYLVFLKETYLIKRKLGIEKTDKLYYDYRAAIISENNPVFYKKEPYTKMNFSNPRQPPPPQPPPHPNAKEEKKTKFIFNLISNHTLFLFVCIYSLKESLFFAANSQKKSLILPFKPNLIHYLRPFIVLGHNFQQICLREGGWWGETWERQMQNPTYFWYSDGRTRT